MKLLHRHNTREEEKKILGLDRYPILSAAAVPMPILILEIMSPIAWGMHTLHTGNACRIKLTVLIMDENGM